MAAGIGDRTQQRGLEARAAITADQGAGAAARIDTTINLPEDGLNFGIIRVCDTVEREFSIVNSGKYTIKYNFSTRPASVNLFKEIFTIEPAEGVLEPGEDVDIWVTCKTSREEQVRNSDLKLHLVEGGTDQVVKTLPMPVALRSVFSKFRVLPVHGINFGPLEIGTSKNKKIQICNDGEFEFIFRLFPSKDRGEYTDILGEELLLGDSAAADAGGKKGDKKADKKPDKGKGGKGAVPEVVAFDMGPF